MKETKSCVHRFVRPPSPQQSVNSREIVEATSRDVFLRTHQWPSVRRHLLPRCRSQAKPRAIVGKSWSFSDARLKFIDETFWWLGHSARPIARGVIRYQRATRG